MLLSTVIFYFIFHKNVINTSTFLKIKFIENANSQLEFEGPIKRKLRSHTRQQNSDPVNGKSPPTSPSIIPNDFFMSINDSILSSEQKISENILCTNFNSVNNNCDVSREDIQLLANEPTSNIRKRKLRNQVQQAYNFNEIDYNQNNINVNNTISNTINNSSINPKNNIALFDSPINKHEINEKQISKTIETNNIGLPNKDTSRSNQLDDFYNEIKNSNKIDENNEINNEIYVLPLNGIKQYVEIKNHALKKRDILMQAKYEIKLPVNFQEFIVNKKNYLIKNNKDIRQLIPFVS